MTVNAKEWMGWNKGEVSELLRTGEDDDPTEGKQDNEIGNVGRQKVKYKKDKTKLVKKYQGTNLLE